jgi:hypothetical protein
MRKTPFLPNERWCFPEDPPMSRESDPDKPWCFPDGPPGLPGADPGNQGCFPESPGRGRRRGPFDLILPR